MVHQSTVRLNGSLYHPSITCVHGHVRKSVVREMTYNWNTEFFCDVTMPFGARFSTCHIPWVTNAIVYMLGGRGIKVLMYVDDLVIVSTVCRV